MPKNPEKKQNPLQIPVKSKLYWILVITGGLLFIAFAWWAMVVAGTRMHEMRDGFWPIVKRILIFIAVIVFLISIFVVIINFWGKQEERDKHSNTKEKETNE